MPRRPINLGRSKLRDADDDECNNKIGFWSREKLIAMDDRFRAAMRRALMAQIPSTCLPPRRALDRK